MLCFAVGFGEAFTYFESLDSSGASNSLCQYQMMLPSDMLTNGVEPTVECSLIKRENNRYHNARLSRPRTIFLAKSYERLTQTSLETDKDLSS